MHHGDGRMLGIHGNRVYPRWVGLFSQLCKFCKLVRIACGLYQNVQQTHKEIITLDAMTDGSVRINTGTYIHQACISLIQFCGRIFSYIQEARWNKMRANKCGYDIMNSTWMLPMAWRPVDLIAWRLQADRRQLVSARLS